MGYTTEFKGQFDFDEPISEKLAKYINAFSDMRHVKRDIDAYKKNNPDWQSKGFNGDAGVDGEFIIDNTPVNPDTNRAVIDYNTPPGSCPSLWCQWIITEDNAHLKWDGAEKFKQYDKWLEYLIENFIAPSGYVLNGDIEYQGEADDDFGTLSVRDNRVINNFQNILDV